MTAAADRPDPRSHVDLVHVMGTVVTLDVRTPAAPDDVAVAFAEAAELLRRTDVLLTTWQPGSWASRLLRGEVELADCPAPLREVVGLAQTLAEATGGWFTPHWRGPAEGPDATGLVKGWVAQQVSDVLITHGLPDHVVNAAGDLVVSGRPVPEGAGAAAHWRVGIGDPLTAGQLAGVLELDAGRGRWAVATSGAAERGPQVADPHTGTFPETVASATAVARVDRPHHEAGAWTDACATALVAAGDRAAELLATLAGRQVLGLLVGADGTVTDPVGLLVG